MNFEKYLQCLKQREEFLDPEYLDVSSRLENLKCTTATTLKCKMAYKMLQEIDSYDSQDRSKKLFEKQKLCESKDNLEATTSSDKTTYTLRSKTPA